MSHTDVSAASTPDEFPDSGPASPASVDSGATTPADHSSPFGENPPFPTTASSQPPRCVPSVRATSDPSGTSTAKINMSPSSTVTGTLNSARRPPPSAGNLPLDLMAKARALQQQRMAMSPHHTGSAGANGAIDASRSTSSGAMAAANLRIPPHLNRGMNLGGMGRPSVPGFQSAPAVPKVSGRSGGPSLSERRAMKLGPLPGNPGDTTPVRGPPKLSDMGAGAGPGAGGHGRPQLKDGRHDSKMNDFKHYIDAEKGWITFEGAATITRTGVNFAGGHTFKISLDEIQVLDELGKGNYGTVFKVRHAKPAVPRFGPGLSGFKNTLGKQKEPLQATAQSLQTTQTDGAPPTASGTCDKVASNGTVSSGTSGKVMAMKEIRLELDEAKFSTILKELVILHECVSPYIIDFYGAFFQEGAVYMCIEFMDGGSIDKLYAGGIPENVLRKITYSTVMGLKSLKDDHNIIHRDVKPTNILANTDGQVKICDFGVSGNLVASIAKTNIGCQSYMAPERISGGGMSAGGANAEGTYSVQSDIWSLGLTIIECAMGRYPYPPEVSSTIFSQLSAIVNGDPPDMPEGYSATACDFVRSCLNKNPMKRYTYSMLLNHPWLKPLAQAATIIEEEDESASESDSDADGEEAAAAVNQLSLADAGVAGDAEVAAWVTKVLERKKNETDEAGNAASTKPALHAAPLAP
ncbi:mitogen-activated protein kinase kinase [Sporothrix schenckii 1099-18]|uniref:mitogen-activated protein kinase kinase n=1 Tax=Sporothrix schenckii 1099-18 TaxID=1397361 RepID=A0A0F2M7B2_SPOSC|nr:mitogen-activated protein kinase kinase [Sporothrix schenckii 1099-18]KJR85578.1 mitogen-activated protein kinase kinase [Sporothrix schenckii 1099-18]